MMNMTLWHIDNLGWLLPTD